MDVNEDDIKFLDEFFSDELTDENMKALDEKLKNEDFRLYYQKRLDEKFDRSLGKLLIDAVPLIIFILLVVVGLYLFIKSN